MELSKVVNISGKSGLFKIVAQSTNRIIVESLNTGKRMPVFARDNFSILSDISIFTYEDTILLEEVFTTIYKKEGGKVSIDTAKCTMDELKAKMEEMVPDYDKDNVYPSDMKKLFKWYNILVSNKIWSPEEEEKETPKEVKKEKKTKKPAAKASPKAKKQPKTKTQSKAKTKTKTVKKKGDSK